MRLKNVTGAKERIAGSRYVIQEPEKKKGSWSELFGNSNPVYLEIGMGKGKFILTMAEQNPDNNYIGIEKYASVLIRALEKQEQCPLKNLYFICMDAEHLPDVFDQNEAAGIYLNFSDPWPKDRHAKRRLTSKQFLDRYDQFLAREGRVTFKTDNKELFDFSLVQAGGTGWEVESYTYDLHNSSYEKGNVMTEYEEKFSAEGKPTNQMIIFR